MKENVRSVASDKEAYDYFNERIDHFKALKKMYREGYLYVYIVNGYISYKSKGGKEV